MQLFNLIVLASGAIAATTRSSPLTKRDASPGCSKSSDCWSLCDQETMKPIAGAWNEGDAWCWLWTGDGSELYGCSEDGDCPTNAKCLPPQTFNDWGGCGPGSS